MRRLSLGADIEARTVKGFSPLVLAVMKVRLLKVSILKVLLLMWQPACGGCMEIGALTLYASQSRVDCHRSLPSAR